MTELSDDFCTRLQMCLPQQLERSIETDILVCFFIYGLTNDVKGEAACVSFTS